MSISFADGHFLHADQSQIITKLHIDNLVCIIPLFFYPITIPI